MRSMITLVLRNTIRLALALAAMLAARPAAAGGSFGRVIELPGHISDLVLDEPRGLLYAANFTAGHVDVISTGSNRLVSSLNIGGQPTALALSPDGLYLVVANLNSFAGIPRTSSLAVINLNDLSRRNFAIASRAGTAAAPQPLGLAFGADGYALLITDADVQRFHPGGGTFETVTTIASLAGSLPVPDPTFPREITRASMTASGDGNYIFGVTNTFVFAYQVMSTGFLNIRLLTTLIHPLAPPQVSASFDGSYFMAGQYLMNRQLRVMAEHPGVNASRINLGGHAIDFGSRTIYASFAEGTAASNSNGTSSITANQAGSTPLPADLIVQDADNLTVRDRLRLREQITGRVVMGGGGRYLYTVSDSGVQYLPLSDLASLPNVRPAVEQLYFQFDYCQRNVLRQQFQIRGNADFEISVNIPGVSFSPSSGTAPATVEVLIDVAAFFVTVQGTTSAVITVTSDDAVNVISPIALRVNVKDQDQRGRILSIPGKLVDLLADPRREQFYVLEQTKNELHVFQNSDLRLLGTFRTGNVPTWMSLSADARTLIVANSSGEALTLINLDRMQNEGLLFMPSGHNPVSVAADNGTVLVAVRTPTQGKIDWVDVVRRGSFDLGQSLGRPGVFQNLVSTNTAMVPLADMSGILIVQADGKVMRWDAAGQEVILARQDFGSIGGAIAAGANAVVVANNVLNLSLVPQAQFADAPNLPAGFTFVGEAAVRTSIPTGSAVDTGTVQRFDTSTPHVRLSPVRMVEQPSTPGAFPFLRSLAALRNGTIVSTSSSGLVELPGAFDAGIVIPRITAITAAADYSDALAPGSLVSIFGRNLAPDAATSRSLPLPTQLANVCLTVNGERLPLLYVSPTQINAQLPYRLTGRLSTILHTPGGLSDIYYASVKSTAPAVFQLDIAGQPGRYPAVLRVRNNQLATQSNPLRANEAFIVFASGLGDVGPEVDAGSAAPISPLANSLATPRVTLGGRSAGLIFAGLTPGFVGLYQINAVVPADVTAGLEIPLTISFGTSSTTVNVRVAE